MKDIVTPVPQEEVRATIKNCLEAAALVNYERVSANTKIEGNLGTNIRDKTFSLSVVAFYNINPLYMYM